MKQYNIAPVRLLFLYFLRLFSFLFILLAACPVMGQVKQKKQLTAADYHLWSTLAPHKISDKGKWTSYSLSYESGADTLFLKSTSGKATYAYPQGYNDTFNAEQWFACQTTENTLRLRNLSTNSVEEIPNVKRYAFTSNGKYLILLLTSAAAQPNMIVRDLGSNKLLTINNVSKWLLNPDGNALVYFTASKKQSSAGLLFLEEEGIKTVGIIDTTDCRFTNPIWQADSKVIAFLKEPAIQAKADVKLKNQLLFYSLTDRHLYTLDAGTNKNIPSAMNIAVGPWSGITISKDCKRVIFGIEKEVSDAPIDPLAVQIWKTDDKSPYAERNIIGPRDLLPYTYVWWPETDRMLQLSDATFTEVMLNGTQTHAVTSDFLAYEPQFKMNSDRDYYITSMETGKKKLVVQKHFFESDILMSPGGRYISYFKDKNWWVYDITRDSHVAISAKLDVPLDNIDHDKGEAAPAYGNPGWTKDDKSFILYDAYDIWEMAPDGSKATRLTNGRENHMVFRISEQNELQKRQQNHSGFTSGTFDLDSPLLLEAKADDFSQSGYSVWQRSKALQPLVYEKAGINRMLKASKATVYLYLRQKFDSAPALMLKNTNEGTAKMFFQSNPQQQQYHWGTARLIDYVNAQGKPLKGILHYPADYQPEKKYPMIVHIYERLSKYLYEYTNPSEFMRDAFNIANLTSQGYFVLSPDIAYTIGNPGISAADCVTAATTAALATASIDPKKIGLIGHSFGGYETDFIITQTNMFAAAIAGAAFTDFTSTYLYPGLNIGKPDVWRFEYQQMRMKKSLFEDPQGYDRNSPVLQAAKISTPLLGWNGTEDRQVPYYQSTELYVALRRLQKRHILLVYPQEGHDLANPANQKDLTHRMEDWFGYYLKDEKQAAWMLPDSQNEVKLKQLSKN
jgi:dipeptidyl aminopeptidase/acylaminoacyl peptidase